MSGPPGGRDRQKITGKNNCLEPAATDEAGKKQRIKNVTKSGERPAGCSQRSIWSVARGGEGRGMGL